MAWMLLLLAGSIGAVGTVLLGIVLFEESSEGIRWFFIFVIVAGIAGLRLSSSV